MTFLNRPYIRLSDEENQVVMKFMNIMDEIATKSGTNDMSDWAADLLDQISEFFSEYEE